MKVALPVAWFAPDWRFQLLPHYRFTPGGLETIGGRAMALSPAERALVDGFRGRSGSHAAGADEAALRGLIARRVLLPVPPALAKVPGQSVDLVLSPHVDDAALSLGASIAGARRTVLVLNIYSRQSYQTGLRVPASRLDGIAEAEDRLAGAFLGYHSLFAGLPGAQDRHGLPLSGVIGCDPSASETAARVERDGRAMMASLDGVLASILSRQAIDRLFVPAGIGGHLDHLVVRSRAIAIACCLRLNLSNVFLYADQPYAAFAGRVLIAGTRTFPDEGVLARKHAALLAFATRLRWPDIMATMADTAGRQGERYCSLGAPVQAALVASAPACF